MGIKAVLFDLDGVVVNSEPTHKQAAEAVLRRKGIALTNEDSREIEKHARGRRLEDVWAYLKEHFHLQDNVDSLLQEVRDALFRLTVEIHLMDGFQDFAKKIKKNYKTALVTSGRKAYLERLDKKLSISGYFDCIVTGDETKDGKPHPAPYVLACKKLNVTPKEAVAIEDAPNGITSAKAAGCLCIAVAFTFPEEELKEADYIARDFKAAGKILSGLK